MSTVRKLKEEEEMDTDEAIRAAVGKRKQLLNRMVDVPPQGFYDDDDDDDDEER